MRINWYPNPFTQDLNGAIELSQSSTAQIQFFDDFGRQASFDLGLLQLGENTFTIPAQVLNTFTEGVVYYHLYIGNALHTGYILKI